MNIDKKAKSIVIDLDASLAPKKNITAEEREEKLRKLRRSVRRSSKRQTAYVEKRGDYMHIDMLLSKLQNMRRGYQDTVYFPPYKEMERWSLEKLEAFYEDKISEISIDSTVMMYKCGLVVSFGIIELVCTKIGINIRGFTYNQMKGMKKYERMLIELGERPYSAFIEAMPVEMRMLGFVVVNIVIFFFAKLIYSSTGLDCSENMMDIFNLATSQNNVEFDKDGKIKTSGVGFGVEGLSGNVINRFMSMAGLGTGEKKKPAKRKKTQPPTFKRRSKAAK